MPISFILAGMSDEREANQVGVYHRFPDKRYLTFLPKRKVMNIYISLSLGHGPSLSPQQRATSTSMLPSLLLAPNRLNGAIGLGRHPSVNRGFSFVRSKVQIKSRAKKCQLLVDFASCQSQLEPLLPIGCELCVRTLEFFPVPDWDLIHKWSEVLTCWENPSMERCILHFINCINNGPWYFQSPSIPDNLPRQTDRWELQGTRSGCYKWTLPTLGKPPLWRAVSFIFINRIGPGIPKVHLFRIFYHAKRMDVNSKDPEAVDTSELLRRLGKPSRGELYPALCKSHQHGALCCISRSPSRSSTLSNRRVRIAKNAKRLNTIR